MQNKYTTPASAKRIREAYSMNQVEFAWILQVHPMTVSKWERGIKAIPVRSQPWLSVLINHRPARHIIEGSQGLLALVQRGVDAGTQMNPADWHLTMFWHRVLNDEDLTSFRDHPRDASGQLSF